MFQIRQPALLRFTLLVTLSVLNTAGMAQEIKAPPKPIDGPGDPPLLPFTPESGLKIRPSNPGIQPGALAPPPPPGSLSVVPGVGGIQPGPGAAGGAPVIGIAEPISGIASIERNLSSAQPELVIDAGGFLGSVADVAISPDGRLVAATGDKVIRIIETATGTVLKTLRGDRLRTSHGNTNGVSFSPDGQYLVVGIHDDGAHGSVRVYRTDNFDVIHQLLPGLNSACSHVEFSRDGRYLATVDGDGQIQIWDWASRQIISRIPVDDPEKPIVDFLQFPTPEPFLLAVKHDGPHIYHVPDGRQVSAQDRMPSSLLAWMGAVLQSEVQWPFEMDFPPRTYFTNLESGIWGAAGVGKSNGRSKPWVALYSADRDSPIVVYQGHKWEVFAMAVSPDRGFVVTGDKFGEVHIWDASTGKERRVIRCQGESIYEAAFTDADDRIVFATKPDLANWTFNRYGESDRVLDLRQRVIRAITPDVGRKRDEVTQVRGQTATILPPDPGGQSFYVALKGAAGLSRYRMPSGRIPSCYTVLDAPKLGVAAPILYADNLGFLGCWNTAGDELARAYRGHESMVTSISPSSAGKTFVTGSTDRTIRIWSLGDHQRTGIFDFKYENSTVISVKPGTSSMQAGVQPGDVIVSLDGHTLGEVYEMMLYGRFHYQPGANVPVVMRRGQREFRYSMRLTEGFDYVEPLLSVFPGDDNQWIIWSPHGYYDCSPGADQLIGWHVNQGPDQAARYYTAQQFRKQLYRPDVIDEIIETGIVRKPNLRANIVPDSPAAIDLRDRDSFAANAPPEVIILSPKSGEQISDPRVTVEATVKAGNDLAINRVTLLHNGTPAKVFRPASAAEKGQLEISHRLRLFPGRNEVSFVAENSASTSRAEDCAITLNAPATERKSQVYVLAVGVSEYAKAGPNLENLKYANQDAIAFSEAVRSHTDGRLYGSVESRVLTNQEATKDRVLDGLEWLADNVQQGDVVMFFCSGHGFLDDRDNFYLGTHHTDPDKLRSTAVSWREIVSTLHEDLPACRRLVFLDACHADGIASGAQNPLQDLAAPELGTVFYASCTLQQKSFENDEWRHGAFTKAILDLLDDRAADVSPRTGDGLVSTVEMALGVTDKVSAMTGDRQNPVVYAPPKLERVNILEFRE